MCPRKELDDPSSESDHDSHVSDSDSDVSMTDSSSSSSESDSGTKQETEQIIPQCSNAEDSIVLNEEEEDDEVVKAIIRERNKVRQHPADIECEDFVTDICFHPSEDIIVAATVTGDALVYKYNNDNNELSETLELHLKSCRDVEFNDDGTLLYSTSKDKSIMVSDMETGKLKQVYENAHDAPVYSLLVVNPNILASGDDDGTVKLWDMRKKDAIFSLKEMEDYVSCMITNDAKKFIVCASGDGTITSLNIGMRKLHIQSEPYNTEITGLATVKHDRKLVAATAKGTVYLFNWGEFGYHSDEFPNPKKGINSLIPITENIILTACEDGILRATHLFPHRHLGVAGQHQLPVECVDISHDGDLIASYGHDQLIKFWRIRYFEDIEIDGKKKSVKKTQSHNLPSSKYKNASDFFADMA
ncbi:WD repeat-containing protein 55 homolog [Gryllus bimaculatus]|nr:WD repeat-containing protein 55 homolog [Gryllus bimaculatus]